MLISYCGSAPSFVCRVDGLPRVFIRGEVVEVTDDEAVMLTAINPAFRWTGLSSSSFDVRESLRGLDRRHSINGVKPLLLVGITASIRPDGKYPVIDLLRAMNKQRNNTAVRVVLSMAHHSQEVADVVTELNGETAKGRWIDVLHPLNKPLSQDALTENHNRLLAFLFQHRVPYAVTMQDDVVLAANAMRRMSDTGIALTAINQHEHRVGVCSFYTTEQASVACPVALWPYPMSVFCGELAVLWMADAANDFLNRCNEQVPHDRAIADFFAESVYACYSHSPCLVDHVGHPSTVGNATEDMHSPSFTGKDAIKSAKPW